MKDMRGKGIQDTEILTYEKERMQIVMIEVKK